MRKMYFLLVIITALIGLWGCKDDSDPVKGDKIGEMAGDGSLSYYKNYEMWGIIDSRPIIDSKIIYLILSKWA